MKKIGLVFSIIILTGVLYHTYEPVDAKELVKTFVTVKSSEANVRTQPSMSSDVLLKSRVGDKLEFLGPEGNWYKVLIDTNTAYLHKNVADVGEPITSKIVVRRYDDSLQTRYSLIAGCFLLLAIGNTVLHRRVGNKTVVGNQTYSSVNNIDEQNAPSSEPENFQIGIKYYSSGKVEDGLKYFRKVLASDEKHARSNYLIGIHIDDNLLAISHLQTAINAGLGSNELSIAKRSLQTRYIIAGKDAIKQGNRNKALIYFENALDLESINDDKRVYEIASDSLAENGFNDLAIQFLDLAIAPYTRVQKSTNQLSDKTFSKEYFKLLEEFSEQMFILSKKLSDDETLIEKIGDGLTDTSMDVFVNYCILYDLAQILKLITNDSLKLDTLETFGISLIGPRLFDRNAVDLFTLEYEVVNSVYENGDYKQYAETYVEISEKANPLNINIFNSDREELETTGEHRNILSLPSALKIIDHPLFDQYATQLYRFATIISKADGKVTNEEEENLKHIYQLIHHPISEKNKVITITEVDRNITLDEIIDELDNLIGLEDVKREVKSLINFIRVQKEREKLGLKSSPVSYHCVFRGSPGTGKTTIARMIAKIYMHLGILEKGHLVETDRSGLIAEYTGQTAVKVNKTVNSALDGILFIDEAYALVGAGQDDYGREAVATLIKRMEDDRGRLIVILAGYTEEMDTFIETNPGFKSRFNRYIKFEDYSAEEMKSIFELQCAKLDYRLDGGAEAKLTLLFNKAFLSRDKTFGNGRFVRNVFEKVLENQANRIATLSTLTRDILTLIEKEDIVS